jgi:hypothetical protein
MAKPDISSRDREIQKMVPFVFDSHYLKQHPDHRQQIQQSSIALEIPALQDQDRIQREEAAMLEADFKLI